MKIRVRFVEGGFTERGYGSGREGDHRSFHYGALLMRISSQLITCGIHPLRTGTPTTPTNPNYFLCRSFPMTAQLWSTPLKIGGSFYLRASVQMQGQRSASHQLRCPLRVRSSSTAHRSSVGGPLGSSQGPPPLSTRAF